MKITINDGQNIIRNLTDGSLSALIIYKPLAVYWPDYTGSIGEYYAVSNFSNEKRKQLTVGLDTVLIDGEEKELYEKTSGFLKLFDNGEYNVSLTSLDQEKSDFHYDGLIQWPDQISANEKFSYNFYPVKDDNYFFTQPFKSINKERVLYYKQLIESGLRPKIIIYALNDANGYMTNGYIIDGHHKLLAYLKLNMNVEVVLISKDFNSNSYVEDLLHMVYPILTSVEFQHIIYYNPRVYVVKNEFTALANITLDNIILNTKHRISYDINKLLIDIINLKDPNYKEWLSERIIALKNNKFIGIGFCLKTQGYSEQHKCVAWDDFPIDDISDINQWISIVSKQTV
jgi:hypothetical protein